MLNSPSCSFTFISCVTNCFTSFLKILHITNVLFFHEVPEVMQTRLSVFEVSILPLSTIFCLNFGIVQRVWYFLLEFWNCSESVVFFAWILELFRECGIFCFSIYCHTKNYMESTITILNTSMIKPRVSDVSVLSSFNYVQLPDSNHYILLSMLICFYTAMNLNWWLNFKKTCLSNHRLLVYSTIIVDT